MNTPEIGTEYTVRHNRKGIFRMRVTSQDDEWLTGIITQWETHTRRRYAEPGDEITVRKSLLTLTPV